MTNRTAPPDQPVRDAAMHDLDRSVFLQAGAGTGKTTVLVGRVVEAVRSGRAALREIVAITFTEKAAGELRDRVRRELYTALQTAPAPEAARLRRAIDQVDAAHIETIHAFASSLLRERPLEAGLDPNFSVLDAVSEQLAFEQDWQDWLWSEEEGAARPRIERCLRLGLHLDHLRDLTHTIAEFRDLDPTQPAAEPPPSRAAHGEWLLAARALQPVAAKAGAESAGRAATLLEQLERMALLPDPALEAELVRLPIPAPPRRTTRDAARTDYAARVRELAERRDEHAQAVRAHALARFIDVAATFTQSAARRRRLRGVLTFADLLIEARDLLAREPRVRAYFRQRFQLICVDEFQDTDPLQAEIVLLLAAQNDTADWREVHLQPGRLFIVGDPKQSIYRFRRADIDIYMGVEAIFRAQREQRPQSVLIDSLHVNFRSRPELVDWHNHVFPRLISQSTDFPRAQPDYSPLTAHRREDGVAVVHLLPNTGVAWNRIAEARHDEAEAIVRFIETVVETDELSVAVHDAQAGARSPDYRDICLLVRNRTNLEIYTEALDRAGIPYHLDSGRGFFLQQEVRDAAAILTALDDPSDEVALVAALKSAPFAASDPELLEYAQAGGKFELHEGAVPQDYPGPLREPIELLRRLHAQRGDLSLPAFVDRVLRETHLLEIQLARARPQGLQRAANLQLIVQRAADFAANEVESLRPFVRWLGAQGRADLPEEESPVTEVEDNVVRVLTIHQAKGLEFPIVILAKMASGKAADRSIAVVDREARTLDFQIGSGDARFGTPGFAKAKVRQERYEAAEERRLLYVAATRARDYLVLPAFYTDRAPGYHLDLEEALPGWMNADYEVTAPGAVTVRVEHLVRAPHIATETPPPDVQARLRDWAARHTAALAAGRGRREFIAPSRLGHDQIKESRETEPRERSQDEVEPAIVAESGVAQGSLSAADSVLAPPAAGDGRDRGTLLHDALNYAEFSDLDASVDLARRLCRERGQDALADAVVADLTATLTSALFERVRAATRVERELPLVVVTPERVVEGYVDLAFEEPAGWVLVDYKSDRDPSVSTVAGYEAQVREYANAFRTTGAPLREAYLLFTATGRAHPVPTE